MFVSLHLCLNKEIALENKLEFNHNYKMIGDLDFRLKICWIYQRYWDK